MSLDELRRRKQQVVVAHGEWTAHNIHLAGDFYTITDRLTADDVKLRRIVQVVADLAAKPLRELRVLDLACLEGLYAVEFARHGAAVVGIEGRRRNIEKARFAKSALSLDNLELVLDDVRNLRQETYGAFDVVLCLGILYHLDAPDVFAFVEQLADVCRGLAVLDTHVAPRSETTRVYRGRWYCGALFREHAADATLEEKEAVSWASLDNPESFWPTRPSLYNLLSHAGFTSAYECHVPEEAEKPSDRVTFVAVKGERPTLLSCPRMNAEPLRDLPEG